MKSQVIITALALFGSMATAAEKKLGCYKTTTGLTLKDTSIYNSIGHCGPKSCLGQAAFAMIDQKCYCGDKIPADADKVDDSKCSIKCPGFPPDTCGGLGNFSTVYDNGLVSDLPKAKSSGSPSSAEDEESLEPSSTASAKPSLVTIAGETVVVTQSSEPSAAESESESESSRPNVAGIAAGVVVGVLAIAGIAGGLFLFMRNRKRRAIEEEHRRNAAVSSFVGAGKPPTSSGGASSFTDTRLDPVMAQRRMSDGSIADNQDYSRRILKVTNA